MGSSPATTAMAASVPELGGSAGPAAAAPPSLRRRLLSVMFILGWMCVSSLLIVLNKQLLSGEKFSFPMALSGMGMLFSAVASFLCCRVFNIVDANKTITTEFYIKRILPVGFFMALTLQSGNAVYLHLSVAFIQMLKAFTPVVTMIVLFASGMDSPNQQVILSVLAIAVGTAISSYGEVAISFFGVFLMLVAEFAEAGRLVMTQMLLTNLKFHPIEGLMYNASACVIWLAVGVALFEWNDIVATGAMQKMMNKPVLFMCAASLGFAVNALAYFVIQLSSSLTFKVVGTVKNAVVVLLGMVVFSDVVSLLQAFGYVISVAGFLVYSLRPGAKGA